MPHDSVINGTYTQDADFHHGALPRNISWYRKHFRLPAAWQGQRVILRFGAIFHRASIWINSQYVGTWGGGYLPVDVRLDNVSSINFGDKVNVIAVRADPSYGSGHW